MWLLFQAPDGVLQAAPEGFTIRRAFSINLRKAFQVHRAEQGLSSQGILGGRCMCHAVH